MQKVQPTLRIIRQEHHLSQEELAEKLGVSRQTIFAIERGLSDPSLTLAHKIAEFFNRHVEEIFFGEVIHASKGGSSMHLIPLRGLRDIHEEIDRFFEDAVQATPRSTINMAPPVNIHHDEKNVYVEFAVPGFTADEIDTEIGDDYLTVRGEKEQQLQQKGKGWLRREFGHANFERTLGLPAEVNTKAAEATLRDGTLTIRLPRSQQATPRSTKLKVKTG